MPKKVRPAAPGREEIHASLDVGSRGGPWRALARRRLVASSPLSRTEAQLDIVSSLGAGVMLFANVTIMLRFGPQTMRADHGYMARLRRGEMDRRGIGPE